MILLVALAVSAVGWLSYRNLEQALLPRVLDRIETQARWLRPNWTPTFAADPATSRPFAAWRRWPE